MNAQAHHTAKQMIASGHDIAYNMKLVQHDLLILIEATEQIADVIPSIRETTNSILVELENTRGVLANSIATANKLYHTGLDALNGGEL